MCAVSDDEIDALSQLAVEADNEELCAQDIEIVNCNRAKLREIVDKVIPFASASSMYHVYQYISMYFVAMYLKWRCVN